MTTALARESVDRVGALVRTTARRDRQCTDRGRVASLVDVAPVALVRFNCGCVAYVPLRRLVIDTGPPAPVCEVAGCRAPRWDGPYCPGHRDTRPAPPANHGESFEPSAPRATRAVPSPSARSGGAIDDASSTASAAKGTPAQAPGRRPQPAPGQTTARGHTAPSAPRASSARAVRMGAGGNETAPAPSRGGRPVYWTRERIIAALQEDAERRGHSPRRLEWRRSDPQGRHPGEKVVFGVFGTWRAALEAAGLTPAPRASVWSRDSIIAAFHRFEREHGRQPSATDWSRASLHYPSTTTVQDHFGSWSAGVRAAGFQPLAQGRPRRHA